MTHRFTRMKFILYIEGEAKSYTEEYKSHRSALVRAANLRPGVYWELYSYPRTYRDSENRVCGFPGEGKEIARGGRPDLGGQ